MALFLDTNVFLYAAGGPHPLKEPCGRILKAVADGTIEAVVDTEVLQELLYVLERRGLVRRGTGLVSSVVELVGRVLPVAAHDMELACKLLLKSKGLPVRDAVHAAVMMNNGLDTVVTADQHFARIKGLRCIQPAEVETTRA
ncbi:MAG: type II toxin-antitoxin system VapC family toxin [Deltaproteobacteria bacterium]|nr:type II toxin-antitoxin system VapC family toxin [Deltaproteobacteria bacterium]